MRNGKSEKTLVVSLATDLAIAAVKLAAALFTGSSSLLAEAVHSVLDGGNEVLLLYGRRVAKEETSLYPLGRDRELFFWAFVVSLLLFSMGGLFSLYEGVHKINSGEPLQNPGVGIAILLFSLVFEGYALRVCFKEIGNHNPYGSLWRWVRHTSMADTLVVTLMNIAGVIGLVIALIALVLSWSTQEPRWDGIGSLMIGLLLVLTAIVLARELKSLLIGESAKFDYRKAIEGIVKDITPTMRVVQLIALRQGMNKVLLAYKLHPGAIERTQDAIDAVNHIEDTVHKHFKEVSWQFVELDTRTEKD